MENPPKKVVNGEEGDAFDKFLSQCGRWYLEECDPQSNNTNNNESSYFEQPKLDLLDLLFPLCETWGPHSPSTEDDIDSSPPPPPFGLDTIQEEEKEGGESNKNNGNTTTIYKYFEFSRCNQPCDCGGGCVTKVDEKREEEEEIMDAEEEYGILKDMFPPDFRDAHSTGRSAFLTRDSLG